MNPQVYTFADAIAELEEFCREASISAAGRAVRSAVRRAYREIVDCWDWASLHVNGRIPLKAYDDDGTATYDHAGGVFDRLCTIASTTFPSDAEDYCIQIDTDDGEIVCDIESRLTDTQVVLDSVLNPGEDVAAGAACVIYPRYYRFPNDFISLDRPVEETFASLGQYTTLERLLELRQAENSGGTIRYFSVGPVPDLHGVYGLYLHPYSDTTRPIDFMYKRKPRDLRYVGIDSSEGPGTITATAGSAAISGSSTAFTADHEGSLLRIGTSTTKIPTGLDGLSPYSEQRSIATYSSATSVTLGEEVETSRSAVKYSITDPIDLDVSAYDAMIALAKKQLAIEKGHKNWQALAALADERLFRAKCGDNRTYTRMVAGIGNNYSRLADAPASSVYEAGGDLV